MDALRIIDISWHDEILSARFRDRRSESSDGEAIESGVVLDYNPRTGVMTGFTLTDFQPGGKARVPLAAGDVRGDANGIEPDTRWLQLQARPDGLAISLVGQPDGYIQIPGFRQGKASVDLGPLLSPAAERAS